MRYAPNSIGFYLTYLLVYHLQNIEMIERLLNEFNDTKIYLLIIICTIMLKSIKFYTKFIYSLIAK